MKFLSKYKYIIMSAIILILISGIIFVSIYFFSDSDNTENLKTQVQVVNSENVELSDNILAGDSTILVVCNSETIGKAMFMVLFDFHILSEQIIITPLDMNVSDGERTFDQCYSYGGINKLLSSVESVRNCKIDRYVIIDKNGIGELTNILGKINLYIDEEYTYFASDKNYSVDKGYNSLESAMLYGYLKSICDNSDGYKEIGETLCTIVNFYISDIEADNAQELFEKLCNCINTDITISDYFTCSSDIEHLLTHNTECFFYNKGEE
ncbi:MAG: LCP family protein [Clostridia bacterium]|nr:LCP family protein [Clostridia bacterium]